MLDVSPLAVEDIDIKVVSFITNNRLRDVAELPILISLDIIEKISMVPIPIIKSENSICHEQWGIHYQIGYRKAHVKLCSSIPK